MRIIESFNDFKIDSPTAVCLGNFDGLHAGHRLIINEMKIWAAQHGLTSVIFTFYPHPLKFFGRGIELLSTPEKREKLFASTGADILFNAPFETTLAGLEPRDFFRTIIVEKLGAKALIVGEDYRFGAKRAGDTSLLRVLGSQYGVDCTFVRKLTDSMGVAISSSRIRELVQQGAVSAAGEFLKRYYSLEGTVIKGDGKGRTFGFPTLNMAVRNEIIPLEGAYATMTRIKDILHRSMTYIGRRPTLNGSDMRVETNIFNFNEDIYGQDVEVYFIERVRGDMKFSSPQELIKQLKIDTVRSDAILEENYMKVMADI